MEMVHKIDADGDGPTIGGFTESRMARNTIETDTPAAFDAIEIAGCTEHDGIVERVAGDEPAHFFSVYLHYAESHGHGVECVGDFATVERAGAYAAQIRDAFGWPITVDCARRDQAGD